MAYKILYTTSYTNVKDISVEEINGNLLEYASRDLAYNIYDDIKETIERYPDTTKKTKNFFKHRYDFIRIDLIYISKAGDNQWFTLVTAIYVFNEDINKYERIR